MDLSLMGILPWLASCTPHSAAITSLRGFWQRMVRQCPCCAFSGWFPNSPTRTCDPHWQEWHENVTRGLISNNVYWESYPPRWPSVHMYLPHGLNPNPNPYNGSPWKEIAVLQTPTHPCTTSHPMCLLILSHSFLSHSHSSRRS